MLNFEITATFLSIEEQKVFRKYRESNFYAYDYIFVKMIEFAIQRRLKTVDFGAVINVTKQKMVNRTRDLSCFLLRKYILVRWLFNLLS